MPVSSTPEKDQARPAGKRRRDLGPFLAALLIGDTLSFLLFAAMGKAEHATGLAFVQVFKTALPFLIAWYAVGLWLGVFRRASVASTRAAVRRVLPAWILAWPLGLELRALFLDRSIPFSFALVVLITNTILLLAWRSAYAALARRRAQ